MDESILTSIKRMLPMDPTCTEFDEPIIAHINTALLSLNQIGIGPDEGFLIMSANETWDQFIATSESFSSGSSVIDTGSKKTAYLQAVKTYIYLSVKLAFDPPTNASVIESINKQMERLEWRLNAQTDILHGKEGDV